MATAYRIVLAHEDHDEFAQRVTNAVTSAAKLVLGTTQGLEFSTELGEASIPQVVAYPAGEGGTKDNELSDLIEEATRQNVSILPIIDGEVTEDLTNYLPASIARINAAVWSGSGGDVAETLLRMLGLVEMERKLFITYRRNETSELAEQLHTALVQRRFDVFLDRFSVAPGVDFQRRLDEELGDKAFVLVLESGELRDSPWVRHEIAFAHARRIEMLALTLPSTGDDRLVPTIDDAFRRRLGYKDLLDEGTLIPEKLKEILEEIELSHARALRRRREQILGSVTEKLRKEGCRCNPTSDWCVFAVARTGSTGLFWVTPRRPEPRDFHAVSVECERLAQRGGGNDLVLQGAVVHEAGRLGDEHQELLMWLSRVSGRRLATSATCSV